MGNGILIRRIVQLGAAVNVIAVVCSAGPSYGQNYAQRTQQARSQANGYAVQGHQGGYQAYRPTPLQGRSPSSGATLPKFQVRNGVAPGVTGSNSTRPRPVAASAGAAGLRQALTTFRLDMGRMPTAAEGLGVLLQAPPGATNWRGPYISVISGRPPFSDPWGNQYQLIDRSHGNHIGFRIRSNGPDGLPNTADDIFIDG